MKYVIVSSDLGLYIGNCLGLGFWSYLDAVDQEAVVVFDSEDQAIEHIKSWDMNNDPKDYFFKEVDVTDSNYASIEDLKKSNLEEFIGFLDPGYMKQRLC